MTSSVKILSKKLVTRNSKFNVYFAHIIDDTGAEVEDYLIVQPIVYKEPSITGVVVIPVMDDRVGLVKIHRPALDLCCWEFPQGFLEEEESESGSASRELYEESGIVTKPSSLLDLGYLAPDGGVLSAKVSVFALTQDFTFSDPSHETGLEAFRFFEIKEFEAMIFDGEIDDAVTIAAWFKYCLGYVA